MTDTVLQDQASRAEPARYEFGQAEPRW